MKLLSTSFSDTYWLFGSAHERLHYMSIHHNWYSPYCVGHLLYQDNAKEILVSNPNTRKSKHGELYNHTTYRVNP